MPPTSKESEQLKRLGNDSNRLRNYLEARKVSNRNIPQTKTSGMLESLLDGKDVKKKGVKRSVYKSQQQRISAKGPATFQKSVSCSNGPGKQITNAKKTDVSSEGSKSIWAKMQRSRKSASSNQQSARSLDDLLGPSSKSATFARASKKPSKKMTQTLKPEINTKIDEKKNPQKEEPKIQLSTIGLKRSGIKRKKSGLPSLTSVPRSNSLKIPSQIEKEPMTGKLLEQAESCKDKDEPMPIEAKNKFEQANVTCVKRTDSDKECQIPESVSSPSEKEARPNNDLKCDSKTMKLKLPMSSCREEDVTNSEGQDLMIPSPSSAHMKMREIEDKKKEIEFQSIKIDEGKAINKQNQNSEESLHRDEIKKRKVNNDNFVRLNMKNNAGACKGARTLKHQNKMKKRRAEWKLRNNRLGVEEFEEDEKNRHEVQKMRTSKKISIHTATDPLNDYLDGRFHSTKKSDEGSRSKKSKTNILSCPTCPRHQRPCKLLVVKKNNGNKGRKFYVCSEPKGEQCDFFQWEDDTEDAVQRELLHSSTTTGFIARQVAGHVDRFKTLTVPELKQEAKRRGLKYTGKKQAIIARLSIWVRDEVSSAVGVESNLSLEDEINFSDSESEDELMILKGTDPYDSDDISSESSHDVAQDIEFEESVSGDDETLPSDPSETSLKCLGEESESLLHATLYKLFGYKGFREGQEWAIRRCLMKKKSLLVAPTGQGKSLCYALPAAMMSGVCIVVSPLVSLMEDQLRHLPPTIPAATLSGTMSAKKLALIIEDLIRNRLKILFVSPERLTSSAFRRLLRPKYNPEKKCYARQLPPVSLLCVDEAHCLSQWGHNFRVSYLRLKTLISKIDPQSILALTATAGPPVVKDICHTLGIHPPRENMSIEQDQDQETQVLCANRDNIDVAVFYVQNEEERLKRLLQILQGGTGKEEDENESTEGALSEGSVIIYVWRQKDSEVLTEQLRSYGVEGGIVCYHGGMDAGTRSKSQNQFLRGKARICVATVAFGLGINKPDVRGVIHVSLPPTPEHYLQEIGRAGRDAKPALAISLVQENELPQKVSLCYSDRLETCQIEVLIQNLISFIKTALEKQDADVNKSPSSKLLNVALPIKSLVQSIDCKEEGIFTILSMLEDNNLVDEKLLDIEGIIPDSVIVTLKKRSINKLGEQEEIISCMKEDSESLNSSVNDYGGTATQKGFSAYSFGVYRLSVIGCVQRLGIGAEPRHVFATLRRLEQSGELELTFDTQGTAIHLKLNESGIDYFRLMLEDDNRVLELASKIHSHFSSQDERRVEKVLSMNKIMRKISALDYKAVKSGETKSNRLILFQDMVNKYFANKSLLENSDIKRGVCGLQADNHRAKNGISSDVMSLLNDPNLKTKDSKAQFCVEFDGKTFEAYTALVLTKVLHGIPTPKTPVLEWYSHPLWGRWKEIEFISLYEYIKTLL